MSCEDCRRLCDEADREFHCQAAREPCRDLSPANRLALDVFASLRRLGPETTWALLDLDLSDGEAEALRRRLLHCDTLWPRHPRMKAD